MVLSPKWLSHTLKSEDGDARDALEPTRIPLPLQELESHVRA
jgi:hypothetical protein